MSKFLFAPFMMNLGESQRLSKLANYLYEQGHDIHILGDNYYPFLFNNDAYRYHHCVEDKSVRKHTINLDYFRGNTYQ